MPLDPATHMGPQAHRQQLDKTLSYVAIGRGEGAELVTGGARIEREELAGGYFVEPTVFAGVSRSEEHTSELQSLMRISYAVFCLKKKKITDNIRSEDDACSNKLTHP